jgi:hypothetical protein
MAWNEDTWYQRPEGMTNAMRWGVEAFLSQLPRQTAKESTLSARVRWQ